MARRRASTFRAEASGLIYQASNMDPASLATNAYGQNYNCTMVQMAAGYASLINGGSYYEPHVVKEILNDEGSVVKSVSPNLVRETVSESTSNFINNALYQTVSGDGGTAGAAAVAGYEVAGKTGTAQKQPRAEKNYLVSLSDMHQVYNPQVPAGCGSRYPASAGRAAGIHSTLPARLQQDHAGSPSI
ncbi:MAG: penicillin-binding transpeptidase domain-containing protein [Clostridium fessum]